MGNNTIHYLAILAILLWVMISCNHPPKSYIFESSDKNSLMDSLLFIEPQHLENGRNVEYFNMKFWEFNLCGDAYQPKYLLEGFFHKKNDSLFYTSNLSKNWQYFLNFDSAPGEDTLILSCLFKTNKEYTGFDTIVSQNLKFITEFVFFDKSENTRICKIRIFQYSCFLPDVGNESLVLFVSEKRGITGAYFCYNASWRKPNSADTIYTHTGNMYLHCVQGFTGLYFEPPYGNYD